MSWRDHLKIHDAAELFPLMSPDELKVLGEDIKKNTLRTKVAMIGDELLDGRNRLDAMELAGCDVMREFNRGTLAVKAWVPGCKVHPTFDPYAYVMSANIHRRHLTDEQRRDLIAKLIKATPEKSNRQIAETVKASHHTVGAVRTEMESTGQIAQLEKTTGKDGKARKQPATKRKPGVTHLLENEHGVPKRVSRAVFEASLKENDDAPENNVASPEEIRKSLIDSIERQRALARSFKKILRVASLDQAMRDEIGGAIGALITDLQSVQRALRHAPTDGGGGFNQPNPKVAALDDAETSKTIEAEPALNAVGKPRSSSFDPRYKSKHKVPPISRLRTPQRGMPFVVGDGKTVFPTEEPAAIDNIAAESVTEAAPPADVGLDIPLPLDGAAP